MLFNVQPHMQQLLPFYSRFTAILNTYYPEIGQELTGYLMKDFEKI